ncbi:hypothetical protein RF11_11591 [Thelohanellus kitauei]|uniref:Uncharacterized protein n=1 Tax=Thelohanellus kitauei TaxID=669202 RepID=A0A0C2IQM7_THEKT|nr:hypothetical protein RF11_11591 [Thelohanellus kitauei]
MKQNLDLGLSYPAENESGAQMIPICIIHMILISRVSSIIQDNCPDIFNGTDVKFKSTFNQSCMMFQDCLEKGEQLLKVIVDCFYHKISIDYNKKTYQLHMNAPITIDIRKSSLEIIVTEDGDVLDFRVENKIKVNQTDDENFIPKQFNVINYDPRFDQQEAITNFLEIPKSNQTTKRGSDNS